MGNRPCLWKEAIYGGAIYGTLAGRASLRAFKRASYYWSAMTRDLNDNFKRGETQLTAASRCNGLIESLYYLLRPPPERVLGKRAIGASPPSSVFLSEVHFLSTLSPQLSSPCHHRE